MYYNTKIYKLFCNVISMLEEIKDTLILQKREMESKLKEKYVKRDAELKLNNRLIKVIAGPRRAGKSFFALHILSKFGEFGYINFDDERLVEVKNYDEIVEAMDIVYKNPKYVLLDEIQNLPRWELFVNRLQRQGRNLVITGSNSNLLSKELATHLTGRHLLTYVLPFSFAEFLKLDEKELTSSETKRKLSEYLLHGGYPEILINELDYKEYLLTLFNSIVYKDIIKRYGIRNAREIEDLAFYLISNVSNEYSYNSLTKITAIKSSHTTEKYLKYLEESFILFSLSRFSYKVKEQLSSNKKIYCIDNGFIQAKSFKLSPDIGRIYENIVAVELKKREIEGKLNIYYWKNSQQEEVDFVIKEGTQVKQLLQVCFDIKNNNTRNREVRSLIKAGSELKCNNLLVITGDFESKEEIEWFGNRAVVKFIPLWKWLFAKD